jgi:hypothetical protein
MNSRMEDYTLRFHIYEIDGVNTGSMHVIYYLMKENESKLDLQIKNKKVIATNQASIFS